MIRPISARLTAPAVFHTTPHINGANHLANTEVHRSTELEATTDLESGDGYHAEVRNSLAKITTTDPWKARNTLRFGDAGQFRVAAAMSCPSLVSNTNVASSPSEIGTEIFGYIKTYDRDLVGTDQMADEAIAYGQNRELSSVFNSQAMTEILNNKNSYTTFDDLLGAISGRKLELISNLSFTQKLKYGLRIKSLLDRFEVKKPILECACRIYARHLGIKVGTAGADLMAYFFRRDKLTAQSKAIFDHVFTLLNTEAAKRVR